MASFIRIGAKSFVIFEIVFSFSIKKKQKDERNRGNLSKQQSRALPCWLFKNETKRNEIQIKWKFVPTGQHKHNNSVQHENIIKEKPQKICKKNLP